MGRSWCGEEKPEDPLHSREVVPTGLPRRDVLRAAGGVGHRAEEAPSGRSGSECLTSLWPSSPGGRLLLLGSKHCVLWGGCPADVAAVRDQVRGWF